VDGFAHVMFNFFYSTVLL